MKAGRVGAVVLVLCCAACAQGIDQLLPPNLSSALAHWRAAVLAGNTEALRQLYTSAPAIQDSKKQAISVADELQFWSAQKKNGLTSLTLDIVKVEPPNHGVQYVKFQAELKSRTPSGAKTGYVVAVQGWQAASPLKITWETRTQALRLKQPVRLSPKLYDVTADATAEIHEAEARAGREQKRVLMVFGGNWCYDCHVLDLAFHSGDIEPTLDRNYVVVHVDIGEYNKNLDVARKYRVPLDKGVPAVAVVDAKDNVIFSQQAGEFEAARSMSPEQILAFLNKWKPPHPVR